MKKVAVYGSLRAGLHNHRLLEESNFIGEDKINNFSMFSLGSFPFIIPKKTEKEISVEVYEVNTTTFARLDALEGYPSFYDRKEVDTKHGKCWIYFMEEGNSYSKSPSVPKGDWKEFLNGGN